MTEQVLLPDESALPLVRLNPPQRTALTRAVPLAAARPPGAGTAKPAGPGNDAVRAAQVEHAVRTARKLVARPAGAASPTRLHERKDAVVETMHFKECALSDETRAGIAAFLSGRV
jgi:hypothetical protein